MKLFRVMDPRGVEVQPSQFAGEEWAKLLCGRSNMWDWAIDEEGQISIETSTGDVRWVPPECGLVLEWTDDARNEVQRLRAALEDIACPSKRNDECEQLKRMAREALKR